MALCGYFPGRRLRKVCALGPAAAGEAVRTAYAAVRTPLVSLSFHDDEFMSARNTESIHGFYVNAPRVMKRLSAAETGAGIGHFGFFRAAFEHSLWRAHVLPELDYNRNSAPRG